MGQARRAAEAAVEAARRARAVAERAAEVDAAWDKGVAAFTGAERRLEQETAALVEGARACPTWPEWMAQARHMPRLCLLWHAASQLPLARQSLPLCAVRERHGAVRSPLFQVTMLCTLVAGRQAETSPAVAQLAEALSAALGSGVMALLAREVQQAEQAGVELQRRVQEVARASQQEWSVQAQAQARELEAQQAQQEPQQQAQAQQALGALEGRPQAQQQQQQQQAQQEYARRRALALASLVEQLVPSMVPANLDTALPLLPLGQRVLNTALTASGCPSRGSAAGGRSHSKDKAVASAVVWLGLTAAAVVPEADDEHASKRTKHCQ
jgi:hypothetical protein